MSGEFNFNHERGDQQLSEADFNSRLAEISVNYLLDEANHIFDEAAVEEEQVKADLEKLHKIKEAYSTYLSGEGMPDSSVGVWQQNAEIVKELEAKLQALLKAESTAAAA